MHILLVEDDKHTADYASRGFKEAGHVVDVLDNGREALIQSLSTEYDVLVVDRRLLRSQLVIRWFIAGM